MAKGFTLGDKLNLQLKGASRSALLSVGLFVDCQQRRPTDFDLCQVNLRQLQR